MDKVSTFLSHVWDRLETILQTIQGWLVWLGLLLLDYIAGHEMAIGLVIGVTLMDAVWGIAVSIKRGKFALSELARLTVAKFAVYGCALLTFVGIDRVIDMDITTSIIAAAITLVELWSASGSMLILYPNMPFLKLLKKALKGEIASKLHIAPEEVDGVLEGKKKRKSTRTELNQDNF